MSEQVQRQMLAQKFRNSYTIDTLDQVKALSKYEPIILKWLFEEEQSSI